MQTPLNFRTASNGRWIPWLFVGGMLGVVAVNAVLIFFAFSSWGGTVTSRPYERGLDYNRVLAAAAREQALGWTADAGFEAGAGGDGALWIVLLDAKGAPIAARMSVLARRPLESLAPVAVAMRYAGDGVYSGSLADLPRQGVWDLRIEVERGAETAHFTRRVVVP